MTTVGTHTVALVEDDDDLRAATAQLLMLAGFEVDAFTDAHAALAVIDIHYPGIVVSDVRMPGMSGISLFEALHARDADLPVILITGHGDVAMAVSALKAGAWDFLTKPFHADDLVAAATRAGNARALVLENRRLLASIQASADDVFVGEAPAIRQLRAMAPMLADSALDLVIEGATGTGKELYARLIHRAGKRGRHRFVVVDCATVPDAIVERELFGRDGLVARAHLGTLFLDNLDAAPLSLQHRLARLAEERAIALDTRDPDPLNLRIIATINPSGRDKVLPTLYHRLAGVPLTMPSLAERSEDIPLLIGYFATRLAARLRVPALHVGELCHRLTGRSWPGNVRELEKASERLFLGLEQKHVDSQIAFADPLPLPQRLDAFERATITDAIRATKGEIAAAIALLQIPRKTFYYRVKRLGIDLSAERSAAAISND